MYYSFCCFLITEIRQPTGSTDHSEVRYFTGDCSSEETQNQIKQQFITVLNSSEALGWLCTKYPGCGIDNVVVECGLVQERKKREVTSDKQTIGDRYLRSVRGNRIKRDYTHELYISFDFFIKHHDEPDGSGKWQEIKKTFNELETLTQLNIKNGTLDLEIENFPMELDKTSFRMKGPVLYCPPGSMARYSSFNCGT